MTTTNRNEALKPGTRVLNTNDGEPGTVHAATGWNAAGEWVEYEVITAAGIEIWKRADFITFDEMNG